MFMKLLSLALCLCALSRAGLAEDFPADARLPRTNLLVYHRVSGEVAKVQNKSDWQKRCAEILEGIQKITGPLPDRSKRCPLNFHVTAENDCGSYILRLLTYSSEPDSRTPAYLLIPKPALHSKRKFPAILALHPTDTGFGHRVVVEQLRDTYRAYARDLAERGYVVLAPAYPLMADYQPDLNALGYTSGTMKAIWDNLRGLDLLDSLLYVNHAKIGAIGHSLGGHNAIFTAAFDSRIRVVVSSCGFDSFLDYYNGDIKGWTSERYMPALLNYTNRLQHIPFDFHELIGTLAPRPIFINAPLHDSNFKSQSVDEIVRAARPIYRLFRAQQSLRVEHPDCGHDFPPEMRAAAYEFFDKFLK
jgi:dienelactone hydrolase